MDSHSPYFYTKELTKRYGMDTLFSAFDFLPHNKYQGDIFFKKEKKGKEKKRKEKKRKGKERKGKERKGKERKGKSNPKNSKVYCMS